LKFKRAARLACGRGKQAGQRALKQAARSIPTVRELGLFFQKKITKLQWVFIMLDEHSSHQM